MKQWTLLITLFLKEVESSFHQAFSPISLLWNENEERNKYQEDTIPRLLPALLLVRYLITFVFSETNYTNRICGEIFAKML